MLSAQSNPLQACCSGIKRHPSALQSVNLYAVQGQAHLVVCHRELCGGPDNLWEERFNQSKVVEKENCRCNLSVAERVATNL